MDKLGCGGIGICGDHGCGYCGFVGEEEEELERDGNGWMSRLGVKSREAERE